MRIDVLTLFPEMFSGYLGQSVLKRAIVADWLVYTSTTFATGHRGSIGKSTIGHSAAGLEWCCGRSRWWKVSRRCGGEGRARAFDPAHAARTPTRSANG